MALCIGTPFYCWLCLLGFSGMGQCQVVTLSDNQTRVIDLHPTQGSHETALWFDVTDQRESRLQIQLRIPFPSSQLILKDPSGRVAVPADTFRIRFQSRNSIHHPERGDRYQLPELRNPATGRWQLIIRHPKAAGSETIGVTITRLARFALYLSASPVHGEAEELILITVLPTDYGAPLKVKNVPVTVTRHENDWIQHLVAKESVVSPTGIRLTNEPGRYFAVFRPANPGTYSFTANLRLPSGKALRSNRVTVTVSRSIRSQTGDAP